MLLVYALVFGDAVGSLGCTSLSNKIDDGCAMAVDPSMSTVTS